MDTGRISSRYAKAVYDLAHQSSDETRLYDEMKSLADNFVSFPDMKKVLDSPAVSSADKAKLLTTAAGIEVSQPYQSLLKLIVTNKRESYAQSIALMYMEYYRKQKGVVITQLITAQQASDETMAKLRELISREEQKKVDFVSKVDSTLIGGFILRLNDNQLDASIKTQLSRMEQQLIEAINAK